MLTDATIRAQAALKNGYEKGCRYFADGHVRQPLRFHKKKRLFEAKVAGRTDYRVEVEFDEALNLDSYECQCATWREHEGACKHVIAVLKNIQSRWVDYFGPAEIEAASGVSLDQPTQELLSRYVQPLLEESGVLKGGKTEVRLTPVYQMISEPWGVMNCLGFGIGSTRQYVLKDIVRLLDGVREQKTVVFGKQFAYEPEKMEFDPLSRELLDLLFLAWRDDCQRDSWRAASFGRGETSAFSDPRWLRLTDENLQRFFSIMADRPFLVETENGRYRNDAVLKSRPPLLFKLEELGEEGELSLTLLPDDVLALDASCRYIWCGKIVYNCDAEFAAAVEPLLHYFQSQEKKELSLPLEAASELFAGLLPALEEVAEVEVDVSIFKRYYNEPLNSRVYLDRKADSIIARLEFCYGERVVALKEAACGVMDDGERLLLRDVRGERRLLSIFRQHRFVLGREEMMLEGEHNCYEFLLNGLPALRESAEIMASDAFLRARIQPPAQVSAGVRLNSDSGLMELSFQYEDMDHKELLALLADYKEKKRYHRLPEGGFIPLDGEEFQSVASLIEQLDLEDEDLEKPLIELPAYRAMYLDQAAREDGGIALERSGDFRRMVQDLRDPQELEWSVPGGLNGKLRDYQKTGVKWLKTLAGYHLGGILADDMGLGKTLQVLTLLLGEKSEETEPSLVIAPTSLVYNWQEEAAKFAPDLKVTLIAGNQLQRQEMLQQIADADLVVTSYGMLKRDIEYYSMQQFKFCFLDEAQHIKNPYTLSARAVKDIRARARFALTGTPVENTLTELWSIFDFVMPGYLKSHADFGKRFETPIVRDGDAETMAELSRHIKPFILRRLKKTVLKELPEKIETKVSGELVEAQAKLYDAWLLKARQEFEQEVKENGFGKSQIKILTLLTRLRQVCCHPGLFLDSYEGGSGKLEMLKEIVGDAISGGHRILVFSQFTEMLNIIRNELKAEGISHFYLDGSTAAQERMRLVHEFNAGKADVFLISLKAGGTGLNLTGADVVIHYDPWWNPAVEDQATDRAYRIGQQRAVQVYKLIAKDTIEEKIYKLQEKKRQIIDGLIQPGETFLNKLGEEEVRELFGL